MNDLYKQNILNKQYLTEDRLYEALKQIFKVDFVRDRQVPESGLNKRPDFRNDELKLIIEFNGDKHYSSIKVINSDVEKYAKYIEMGYKVIPIPYFVQLSSDIIKLLFDIDMEWQQQYPHGFIDKKAMLPVDYNCHGIQRFKGELKRFEIIKSDIIQSLESKIELLGENNVLPYGVKLSDFY